MDEKMEEYIDVWKRKLEEKEKYIDEVRSIKHDIQAHFVVLQYYLDSAMYEDAKMYLKMIRKHQEVKKETLEIDLGNSLVNAIVEEYLSKGDGITFCSNGRIPDAIGIAGYDLCILFSNLISNAVEACEKLSRAAKIISMTLCESERTFEISVENPIEWQVDEKLLGKGSTKEDKENHGYGIRNIRDVVHKYNGDIDFGISGNIFSVKISFPKQAAKN